MDNIRIYVSYGDEDQNDLMWMIDDYKGDDEPMEENRILKLMSEVDTYKQAIEDAKDALASAEMELDMALDDEFSEKKRKT